MKHYLLLVAAWLLVGLRPALGADDNGANEDPPVIDIALTPDRSSTTADFLVYDGEPLSFDGSGSYDPDGGALTKHDWTINYTSGKPKDYAGVVFDTSYALANGSMQTMRLLIRDDENNYVSKTVTIEVVAAPVVEWERTYFIRDHLGSVRVAFNEEGDVVEATDYYPFGLQMPTRSFVAGSGVKENFTGHELDAGNGLLYAGARYLDPTTGRWLTVDPLAADYPGMSAYNYAANNPLINYDPDGRSIWTKLAKAAVKVGKVVARDGVRSLGRGATYADAFAGIVSDVKTLTAGEASTGSRFFALVSLASEISPISIGDVKEGARLVNKITDGGQRGANAVPNAVKAGSEAFSKEKQALVEMAKRDKRLGMTGGDMQAYKDLNRTLPDPFPEAKVRGPEVHAQRSPDSPPGPGQQPHGHVGPVSHIPIKD